MTFRQCAPQGFGDRHNSWAWSMLWWRGKLFVGTNRAWLCAERAAINAAFPMFGRLPFVKYPPEDPDTCCTPDPADLPLQAEIWCWTPETDHWERLYQSSADVPIPNRPSKFVARDIGYRYMATFIEPDGTEALYVAGVSTRFIFKGLPPPRLLRSTDGVNFSPVPQTPGTFMGDLDVASFRSIISHRERLFLLAGKVYGDGVLLETRNPAAGDNAFRHVSPPDMRIFEMVEFNGSLYLGLRDTNQGYAVVKIDVSSGPPYTFVPVVSNGAFLLKPSQSVLSMYTYQGRLYVGTDRPAELIRINPDDTWDLVIGTPRQTPAGWKYPLSGLDAGFSNWLNGHLWRMQEHNGRLYIGTMKMATHFRTVPKAQLVLEPNVGVDLFETDDGWHYSPVTVTGFGDKFNFGVRSFASTPHGLFVGMTNSWYGLQVWRGIAETKQTAIAAQESDTGQDTSSVQSKARPRGIQEQDMLLSAPAIPCPPPLALEAEVVDDAVILSWEYSHEAKQFWIWRALLSDERRTIETNPLLSRLLKLVRVFLPRRSDAHLPPLPEQLWIPGKYQEIGTRHETYFQDHTVQAGQLYLYYVQAESIAGTFSGPSNLVAGPSLAPPITFADLLAWLPASPDQSIRHQIESARRKVASGSIGEASEELQNLLADLEQARYVESNLDILTDLPIRLRKLHRRLSLSQIGIIPSTSL